MSASARDADGRTTAGQASSYPKAATEARSANMRAIRRRDTKPEVALASALHRSGFRFRRDYPIKLDGITIRPDIVFTKRRVAVFVDGCFWHLCPEHGHVPAVNEWYWEPKLSRTQERDGRNNSLLDDHGWSVVRIWEHEPLDEAITKATQALKPSLDQQSR
ncbi:MAG: very short patch repair endonuclease [Propionicimonas sp.]